MITGTIVTEHPPRGGWLWRPLVGATLSQVVLGITRPSISYSALELGADGVAVGILAACYAVIPMLIALPVGRLSGRLRHIALVPTLSALLLIGATALAAVAEDLVTLAIASALFGVANLSVLLGAQSWISRSAPSALYNQGFGWMTAGMALGQAIGPLIAGALIGPIDLDRKGISSALWVASLVSITLTLVFVSVATRDYGPSSGKERVASWEILRLPGVARYLFVSAAVLTSVDIVTAYLPVLGATVGIAPVLVGAMLATRGVMSTLSRVLLGPLGRRWGESRLIIASAVGAGVCLAVVGLVPLTWVLFVAMAVGGFFLGMGQPLTMTAVAVALPARQRSDGLALRLLGNRAAQTVVPLVASVVTVVGVASVFYLQVALLLASAVWEARAARKR